MRVFVILIWSIFFIGCSQLKSNEPKVGDKMIEYKWVEVARNAKFAWRDGLGLLPFHGRLWIIGGWNPNNKIDFPKICNNEVLSSIDGNDWTIESPNTFGFSTFDSKKHWEGRHTAGYAVYKNKMWIVGGDANQGHYMFDVWNSGDGRHWQQINAGKPVPWGPRILHHTVVLKDKLYIIGGQTMHNFTGNQGKEDVFYRDIWSTTDGVNWEEVKPVEPYWSARGQIGGCAVKDGRVYILGGGTYDTPNQPDRKFNNDVWSSDDMVHWVCHTANAEWMPRQYHEVAVWDNKLWVMEGCGTDKKNRNDVWYSEDGIKWTELSNTPWKARHAAGVTVYNGALWIIAGNNMEPDVWKLVKISKNALDNK